MLQPLIALTVIMKRHARNRLRLMAQPGSLGWLLALIDEDFCRGDASAANVDAGSARASVQSIVLDLMSTLVADALVLANGYKVRARGAPACAVAFRVVRRGAVRCSGAGARCGW